jgi:hypothetical protein
MHGIIKVDQPYTDASPDDPFSRGDCVSRMSVKKGRVRNMAASVKLEQLITCPKCGESNPKDSRHCTGCGASLVGVKPATPSAAEKKKPKLVDRLKRKA